MLTRLPIHGISTDPPSGCAEVAHGSSCAILHVSSGPAAVADGGRPAGEERAVARAGRFLVDEPDQQFPARVERGHAGQPAGGLRHELLEPLAGLAVAAHVADRDLQVRLFAVQLLEETLGVGAMGAAFAHEELGRLRGGCAHPHGQHRDREEPAPGAAPWAFGPTRRPGMSGMGHRMKSGELPDTRHILGLPPAET